MALLPDSATTRPCPRCEQGTRCLWSPLISPPALIMFAGSIVFPNYDPHCDSDTLFAFHWQRDTTPYQEEKRHTRSGKLGQHLSAFWRTREHDRQMLREGVSYVTRRHRSQHYLAEELPQHSPLQVLDFKVVSKLVIFRLAVRSRITNFTWPFIQLAI